MQERIFSILLIVICLSLPVVKCYSRQITVGIIAEVTEVAGYEILEGKVKVGDIIEGTYTYDTSAPGKYPSTSGMSNEYEFSSAPCGILLKVGGLVFQTDPNDVEFIVKLMNDALGVAHDWDRFTLRSRRNIMFIDDIIYEDISMDSISIYLEDSLLSSYGFYHPLTALLTTALPASAPVLADWSKREIELSVGPKRGQDNWFGGLHLKGHLTSAVLVSAPPKVIYVDDDAAGANDGSNWADAYIYLQDALADANSADKPVEICVAQGFYPPDRGVGVSVGDREATFQLFSQVAVKGGYAGLKGRNPDHRNVQGYETILTGDLNGDDLIGFGNRLDNSYHVVSAIETDETAVLDGFNIISGNADGDGRSTERRSDHTICGGGLYINSANPTVVNCTFRNNFAYEYGGGLYINEGYPRVLSSDFAGNVAGYGGGVAVCSTNSNNVRGSIALLDGCLIQGNSASLGGASFLSDAKLVLVNCTVADNRPYRTHAIDWSESHGLNIYNSIIWNAEQQAWGSSPSYSNISGNVWLTRGNINEDPLFADPGYWADAIDPNISADPNDPNAVWVDGDYHLKSQAGRWDPNSQSWIVDDVTSPCIDSGDPNSPIQHEPFPNGGIINMGAYGGSSQTSKSYFGKPVCETIIAGDINGDCKVDFKDFAIMSTHWLEWR